MDRDDRVAVVVLAGELHRHLDLRDFRFELIDERLDVGVDILAVALQLQQHVELFRFRVERFAQREAFFYARALAADFLRSLRVVPESGRRDLFLDFLKRVAGRIEVKDSSGPIGVCL
jgi:hypothetical protein